MVAKDALVEMVSDLHTQGLVLAKLKTPEGTPTTQFNSLTSHHYYKLSPLTVSTNAGYQAAAGE